jgi:hypothetical protein
LTEARRFDGSRRELCKVFRQPDVRKAFGHACAEWRDKRRACGTCQHCRTENLPHFFFHAAAMKLGQRADSVADVILKVSNNELCHEYE